MAHRLKAAMLVAALIALWSAFAQTASPPPSNHVAAGVAAPADHVPTDVRRTTLIVRDIDRSLRLYRDVFGLSVNYDTIVTTSGKALPAGAPGSKVRLVLVNSNDPWVGWMGFMQWLDPKLPDPGPCPLRIGIGAPVLVMNTDDVDARCAAAAKVTGVTMTAPPTMQEYPGRNGAPTIHVRGCNFFDPDGTMIELNQIQI